MAVPAYATDLNDIYLDTANFSTVGGGRVTDVETDDYIQGSNCWSHDPFSSGIEGGMYDDTTAPTITTDDCVFIWTKCDVAATLASHAAGGIQIIMGTSATAYDCFYALGSDDYQYGGWKCIPVDPTKTPSTSVGTPGSYDHFGVRWNVPSTGASKGYPMKIDAIRYGRNLEITAGEIANPATWDATAIYDSTTTRQWGICQPTNSGAEIQGIVYWGTAAALVYSRDSNRTITIIDTEWTSTDFTKVLFAHASNDIVWDNVGLLALGTNNRGIIDVTANGAITWTNSVFQDIDTTTMLAGSTFDGCKWIGCNEVDSGGGSLLNAKILAPTVAADSYSLLWNVNADPDGSLDGMEFSKGTNAHHAIEFGTAIPDGASYTLTDCDFGTDFSATEGGTTGDETFNFLDTTGSITLNLVGCTGNAGYRTAGVSVTIVNDPVTVQVTTRETDGDAIGDVAVMLKAKDATGPFPFEESITITRSGTVATVTHTAHGMATGDYVLIRDAADENFNIVAQITVTNTTTYTYTVANTGAVADIVSNATFVALYGSTNATTGILSTSRVYPSNQPVTGWSRKSSGSPYYKEGIINGIVYSASGLAVNAVMVLDE